METDEDDPDDSDSDYNSVDAAERDAQDVDDDGGTPKPKVYTPTSGLASFEAISIRDG
jgi:hypothetical protein